MARRSRFWAPVTSDSGKAYNQLRQAVIKNDSALLKDAMESKIDLNALFVDEPGEGTTALHEAARRGHVDVIHLLIENGAEIDIREASDTNQFNDDTPLYCAARSAQSKAVHALLEAGADPTLLGSGDNAPFAAVLDMSCYSAKFGHQVEINEQQLATIDAFIAGGVDINDRQSFQDATVAQQAVILADIRLIQHLFDHGASREGLLEMATTYNNEDNILKYLVNQGAHDTHGKAIYQAARRNKPRFVSFLLHHAESAVVAESSGALHVATEKGCLEVLQILLDHAIRMMIEKGADVNAIAENTNWTPCTPGDTPLHLSTYYCLPEVLAVLLSAGANVHNKNNNGETPLNKLIANSLELNASSKFSVARLRGVQTLKEAGSDVHAISSNGKAALQLLQASPSSDIDDSVGTTKDDDDSLDKSINQPERRDLVAASKAAALHVRQVNATQNVTINGTDAPDGLSFEASLLYFIQIGLQNNSINIANYTNDTDQGLTLQPHDSDNITLAGSILPDSYGRVFHLNKFANGDIALRILDAMDSEQAKMMNQPLPTTTLSICTSLVAATQGPTAPATSATGSPAPSSCSGNQIEGFCTMASFPSATPDSGATSLICYKVDDKSNDYLLFNATQAAKGAADYCANLVSSGVVLSATSSSPAAGSLPNAAEKGGFVSFAVVFDVYSCDPGTTNDDQKLDFKKMGQDQCYHYLYTSIATSCAKDDTWADYNPEYSVEGGMFGA
ncbi:MAG: Ankyrin-2 [Bathelium mastoideum]|nr:MAG: Ankyrin-2 [Bathelium mastoideum]